MVGLMVQKGAIAAPALTSAHRARGLPSATRLSDATPVAEIAATAILALPFTTLPFVGELIATLGAETGVGADVVTDTLDDWADVLPAAS